ncbi:MAG: Acg family FMN-binding oxidoreductase [Pleurocapsa sp.]
MINLFNIFPVVVPTIERRQPQLVIDPWQVREDDFPVTGSTTEKLKFLLNYAVLAPSGHNTQPWLFKLVDDAIELYGDLTRALPIADRDHRELIISCGAALFHLKIAINYFGYQDLVQVFPEKSKPDLLARIELGNKRLVSDEEKSLFHAIVKRRTNRLPFTDRQLQHSLLLELRLAASSPSTQLQIIPDNLRPTIINLITQGDRTQLANPLFRQELAQWIHSEHSPDHDGIPIYAQGIDERFDALTPIIALAIRSFNLGKSQSAQNQKLAAQAPTLVLLTSRHDTPHDWLVTGEALAHLLLRARVDQVWASFFNQPIQIPQLRSQLQALFPNHGYPQILLRLGYGQTVKSTPRRSVGEVISN